MDTEELYVHMVNGIDNYVPIPATTQDGIVYEILQDAAYDEISPFGELFEFYPGDLVEVYNKEPLDDYQHAGPLIYPGNYPDRKYYAFLYLATTQKLQYSKETYVEYQEEIERVKQEINNGMVFYRNVLDLVGDLGEIGAYE